MQGRKHRGTGGTVPPKFEVGDGPCIRPPNILRSSVVGCARKHKKSKQWCFSCEERVMFEGSCTTFNKVKIRKISSKNLVDDYKKSHQKFLRLKWKFFQKIPHLGQRKKISVPPNSAPGFRHWPNVDRQF